MGLEVFDTFVQKQLIEMVNGIYTDKDLINMMKKTVETYEKHKEFKVFKDSKCICNDCRGALNG